MLTEEERKSRRKASRQKWKANNKDKVAEQARRNRERNPEATKERLRRFYDNNPSYLRVRNARRKGRCDNVGRLSKTEWQEVLRQYGNKCLCCGAQPVTIDHVTPLCKGGEDRPHNVQSLCYPCNARKGVNDTDYRTSR